IRAVWPLLALAEQARNRDHDTSDECEQARKQHNVPQEHTHTCASPSSPCAGAMLAPQSSAGNQLGGCCSRPAGIALLSFRAGGVPSGPAGHLVLFHRQRKDRLRALSQQRTFSAALTNSANFFRA